jgi:hypothetical protein
VKRPNIARMNELALAVARGEIMKDWCAAHGLVYTTAKAWSKRDDFKQKVACIRQEWLDAAIGKYHAAIGEAADIIANIARDSSNRAVQLAAARAVGRDLIDFMSHSHVMSELNELREQLRRLTEGQGHGTPSDPPGPGGAPGASEGPGGPVRPSS